MWRQTGQDHFFWNPPLMVFVRKRTEVYFPVFFLYGSLTEFIDSSL